MSRPRNVNALLIRCGNPSDHQALGSQLEPIGYRSDESGGLAHIYAEVMLRELCGTHEKVLANVPSVPVCSAQRNARRNTQVNVRSRPGRALCGARPTGYYGYLSNAGPVKRVPGRRS